MSAFLEIVRLEFRAVVRSWSLALLAGVAMAWPLLLPYLLHGDGTAAGEYQVYVHYALGGVCLLLTVALAATAAGSLAKDRAAKRLPLTVVRPVPYALVVWGRATALTLVGALVLAVASAALVVRLAHYPRTFVAAEGKSERMDFSLARPCYHVLSPVMEKTARQEAEEAYEKYRTDPATSNNVAGVDRSVALDILTQRAEERFDLVEPGKAAEWKFAAVPAAATRLAVRMKFANSLESYGDFRGRFTLGDAAVSVSNVTQAVLVAPLAWAEGASRTGALRFDNASKTGVMLRPRKDLQLLYGRPGDVFAVNLASAYAMSVAMIALVVSFGLFLSACLNRSVAVFATVVLLLAAEIAPSILDECTEEQVGSVGDRIGMRITSFVEKATRSIGSSHPIETLSCDECLEARDVLRTVSVNLVALPLVFAFLAALVIPKKPD